MHILIAPNAFKNSLNAADAADAIRKGLEESSLAGSFECFPIGDGGDGTGALIIERLGGNVKEISVRDPLGKKIRASLGFINDGSTAVIEMANASGLRLLNDGNLNPLQASSSGTGDLMLEALNKKAKHIILGMGGSATVDGGTGILKALGVRFLDSDGKELQGLPESLLNLDHIDSTGLDPRLRECEITVLCDVDNPLLGGNGTAAVFAPQKGASPRAVRQLEEALGRFARVVQKQFNNDIADLPSGGTAGGAAAGLHGLLAAKLVNGIDYFLKITGFDAVLNRSDWVITGEGSIDEQTLRGKGPFGVARYAKNRNLPVIGLAGKIPMKSIPDLNKYFDVLMPIGNEPCSLSESLQRTAENLMRTASAIGNLLAARGSCVPGKTN